MKNVSYAKVRSIATRKCYNPVSMGGGGLSSAPRLRKQGIMKTAASLSAAGPKPAGTTKAACASGRVFLGLGGNLGDPEANLVEAAERLERKGLRIVRASSVYKTEPVGMIDQPWFFNQVLEIETEMSPVRLLRAVKSIERALGRKPGPRNGPRPIDIDILLAGDIVLKTAELEIPHARMTERKFVLVPLAEIAPAAVHPLEKKTVSELLRACPDRSNVFRIGLSG